MESVESIAKHHRRRLDLTFREGGLRGTQSAKRLKHIGPWLSSRIQRCRLEGDRPVTNLGDFVAYLVEDEPCTSVTIHRRMADVLQNSSANATGAFENSPIVEATGVAGKYIAADVNTLGYRSVVALLHVLNAIPLHRRLAKGFHGLPERIPVISMREANRITAVSDSGKHCRAHGDSEGDCRALRRHCRWARDGATGATNCVPKGNRTRSAMGTGRSQSAKTTQRDVPGIGARAQRGTAVARWRRPDD